MAEMPDLSEFDGAIPLKKFHRYMIADGIVGFGLMDQGDGMHRFLADPMVVSAIGEELTEVGRGARHAQRSGGSMDGFIPMNARIEVERLPDGRVAPLVGVMMKLARARGLLDQLFDVVQRYAADAKFEATKISEENGVATFKLHLQPKPPVSIPLLIGDIAHNARSALDVLINDIAEHRRIRVKRLAFPFAKDAKELGRIIRRDIHPIGADVASAVEKLRPYTGGNADLVGLHELNIVDKHRMVVPAFVSIYRRFDYETVINKMRAKDGQPPLKIAMLSDGTDRTPFQDGQIVSCAAGETPFENYTDEDAGVEALFPRQGNPFPGGEVIEVLNRLLNMTDQIGMDFATRFGPPVPTPPDPTPPTA